MVGKSPRVTGQVQQTPHGSAARCGVKMLLLKVLETKVDGRTLRAGNPKTLYKLKKVGEVTLDRPVPGKK